MCCPYLLQLTTACAQEDHTVAVVDVRGDGGQSVPGLRVHGLTRHQLGAPQGLVDIQATEVVIDGDRLQDIETSKGGG